MYKTEAASVARMVPAELVEIVQENWQSLGGGGEATDEVASKIVIKLVV